jgi:hypothetical protein
MGRIELTKNNEVVLGTSLTKGQVAKFNILANSVLVKNGAAYLPLDQLHGALLTNSRNTARELVQAYRDILRIYLVGAEELETESDYDYIRPIGIQVLLDQLVMDRPKRANDYRASSTLIAYIVASHPQLALGAVIAARELESQKQALIQKLKKQHKCCQLSRQVFGKGHEKHVHHIVAEAINPGLVAAESNLIVITGSVHDEYHAWIKEISGEVCRQTLRNFARRKGYSLEWDRGDSNALSTLPVNYLTAL